MLETMKTENQKKPIESASQDRQRLCGTFVLRQDMDAMTEKDRSDFLDSLEIAGFLRSI